MWLIAIPVAILLAVVVGPWVYINLIRDDPPDRLTLADAATSTTDGSSSSSTSPTAPGTELTGIDGTWTVSGTSNAAGYRVKEVLFGQDAEAVGRTDDVTGSLTASGTTITATEIEVDMTTVASDESRRDSQFHNRIMSTDEFPTATFALTSPIDLGQLPAEGEEITVEATGELTLRGVTQEVTVALHAVRQDGTIVVNATIPIDFDDYEIPDASGGPASVGRTGDLELLMVFSRA